ncbi:MAG: glycine--tRNA ligase [Defluviitaleaceae bacterium]|nr:glycine--tRNA ligase [Defluviitaleaceae bacterium]
MVTMDKITALAKGRGFIYAGSEIYGGLANTWDYGPLGVEFKNNIKAAWWQKFVKENPYNVGLDASILMNPRVWEASGHVGGFSDPLMDCKLCKERFRADKIIEEFNEAKGTPLIVDGWEKNVMKTYVEDNKIPCPSCGGHDFTEIREFNLMFKTSQGVTESSKNVVYLRPETAQGIFVNFKNVQRTSRKKIPFGIAQIGKAFRNEITPGNFVFRTREFEQMELEFFCHPTEDEKWFRYWVDFCQKFLKDLGMKDENIRLRNHSKDELSHYSKDTTDIEFKFPFGYGELWGIANRTNYDLQTHTDNSEDELIYFDPATQEKFVPYCIEPSLGADRVALAFLCNSYEEEEIAQGDVRTVLRLHPVLAPVKAAILPLSKKLAEPAHEMYLQLTKIFACEYDETGSIGKRYRRQDEIGTPFCITYDFDSQTDNTVTIRHRDSMEQERMSIDEIITYIQNKINFY